MRRKRPTFYRLARVHITQRLAAKWSDEHHKRVQGNARRAVLHGLANWEVDRVFIAERTGWRLADIDRLRFRRPEQLMAVGAVAEGVNDAIKRRQERLTR